MPFGPEPSFLRPHFLLVKPSGCTGQIVSGGGADVGQREGEGAKEHRPLKKRQKRGWERAILVFPDCGSASVEEE